MNVIYGQVVRPAASQKDTCCIDATEKDNTTDTMIFCGLHDMPGAEQIDFHQSARIRRCCVRQHGCKVDDRVAPLRGAPDSSQVQNVITGP
jgi:hypothetical protein